MILLVEHQALANTKSSLSMVTKMIGRGTGAGRWEVLRTGGVKATLDRARFQAITRIIRRHLPGAVIRQRFGP